MPGYLKKKKKKTGKKKITKKLKEQQQKWSKTRYIPGIDSRALELYCERKTNNYGKKKWEKKS